MLHATALGFKCSCGANRSLFFAKNVQSQANITSRRDYREAGAMRAAFNVPCRGKRIGNNRRQTCSSARKSHQRPAGISEQQDEDEPCRGQKSPVTYEAAAS